jgi:NAD(P)H-hydrate epimerase
VKPIISSKAMAQADRYTIDVLGKPSLDLMEAASRSVFDVLSDLLLPGGKALVVCGAGHNGGDGFAVARMLHEGHFNVSVVVIRPVDQLVGDARVQADRLAELNVPIQVLDDSGTLEIEDDVDWIVDALFGTGLNRHVQGALVHTIQAMNSHMAPVLAVDIPSGLNGDHGFVIGPHIEAAVTVTFQAMKFAHAVAPAANACGNLYIRDIGISFEDTSKVKTFFLEAQDYVRLPRPTHAHKGTFGTLAIVGGFQGMEGAANLAARAALRFGAGKVRIHTDNPGGRFYHDAIMVGDAYKEDLGDRYDALVVGCGLGRPEKRRIWLERQPLETHRIVWDADGLYAFVDLSPSKRGHDWVATPHAGEAAMLLNSSADEVQRDRQGALEALAEAYPGGWWVLKGNRTMVAGPHGERYVIATGHPALAVAGSGDVLAGMIGALLAGTHTTDEAVLLSVLRHGMTGERWSAQYRDYAMLPDDMIDDLRF